jgi:hypothetical protein
MDLGAFSIRREPFTSESQRHISIWQKAASSPAKPSVGSQ